MNAIFVAGTDTGIGKTVVAGCLARYISEKGYRVITQKWIQTGSRHNFSADIRAHLDIMGKEKRDIEGYLHHVAPYIFRAACSPHLASEIEDKKISRDKIIKSFKFLSGEFDFVIAEGLGGVSVPFDKKHLAIDIVKELNLPVLLVVGNKLGAINHALLTIEALRKRKIKILGLVFNNLKGQDGYILKDNPRIIRALSRQRVFGALPWLAARERLYKRFVPIGDQILKRLLAYG
ncbi:MAG: dethiobiotin synthase [Candidatus Omnitrophica bacterium]|nr:dethiobiotin synthase [Candidatus Omnitrophota bacterium]